MKLSNIQKQLVELTLGTGRPTKFKTRRTIVCLVTFFLIILLMTGKKITNGAIVTTSSNLTSINMNTAPTTATSVARSLALPPFQAHLVETPSGQVLESQNAELAYNPASAIKIMTAYVALKTYGPQHRFETKVILDGTVVGRSLVGDLFFNGNNPFLNKSDIRQISSRLAKIGISSINGSISVSPDFVFERHGAGLDSAKALVRALKRTDRTRVLKFALGHAPSTSGGNCLKTASSQGTVLAELHSKPLLEIVKDCLSRSDNAVAELLGELVGGPTVIGRTTANDFKIPSNALVLQTASGLGVNRVTPNAMLATLRGFSLFLSWHNLTLSDALPIAGITRGTILRRFANSSLKGVLVGKTGTLHETDNGASVLVGEMNTHSRGKIFFVIFQRGRNTTQLRNSQNKFLENLLRQSGGAGSKY